MEGIELEVECYAGYRGEQEPRCFRLGGTRREVLDVIDRWIAPQRRYFKLKADDGGIYILQHDEGEGWCLAFYDSGALDPSRVLPG